LFQRAKLQIRSGEAHRAGPLLDRLELNHPEDLNVRLLRSAWARALVQPEAAARADDAAGRARATLVLDDTELFLKPIRRQYGLVRDFALARDQAADTQAMRAFSRRILDDPLWRNFYLLTLQDAAALLMSYPHTQWARPLLERQFREQQFPTAEYWELLGSVLEKEDEPEQAWQAWNKAVRMVPNAQRHAQVARLARKRDEPALAEIHERRARLLEGCEFLDANQVENAHDRFQEVVARDPQDAQAWFLLGETERLRGDDEAARQNYEQCLRLNPDNGRARARLGMP
jgi:tetratricopeptide (TPR) repeat protein